MLGRLARWLRAAGYETSWHPHIADWDLIRLGQGQNRVLLSSDKGMFRCGVIRDHDVPALWIPHGLSNQKQLAFVLRELRLPVCAPRCMACGGALIQVARESLQDRVPPRSFERARDFWQCQDCGKIFWQGTHWHKIADCLRQAQCDQSSFEPAVGGHRSCD